MTFLTHLKLQRAGSIDQCPDSVARPGCRVGPRLLGFIEQVESELPEIHPEHAFEPGMREICVNLRAIGFNDYSRLGRGHDLLYCGRKDITFGEPQELPESAAVIGHT
jgi:hypothetical protein